MRAIMASLDGDTSLVVGKGVIKHQLVQLIGADLFTEMFAPPNGRQTANLNCMVARFDLRKGLATAHGLLMDTEDVTMVGHGTVDLDSQRIALEVTPRPKQRGLLALPLTVDIGGTLTHPVAQSNKVLIAKDVAVDIVTDAVGPATDLIDGEQARNPCLRALNKQTNGAVSGAGTQSAAPKNGDSGIGGLINDIGRSIDRIFEK